MGEIGWGGGWGRLYWWRAFVRKSENDGGGELVSQLESLKDIREENEGEDFPFEGSVRGKWGLLEGCLRVLERESLIKSRATVSMATAELFPLTTAPWGFFHCGGGKKASIGQGRLDGIDRLHFHPRYVPPLCPPPPINMFSPRYVMSGGEMRHSQQPHHSTRPTGIPIIYPFPFYC